MDRIFRVSQERLQARSSALWENFDDADAEKTSRPGEDEQFDQNQSIISEDDRLQQLSWLSRPQASAV
jgi:hypothetical protein